jgi:hypothetical protein
VCLSDIYDQPYVEQCQVSTQSRDRDYQIKMSAERSVTASDTDCTGRHLVNDEELRS